MSAFSKLLHRGSDKVCSLPRANVCKVMTLTENVHTAAKIADVAKLLLLNKR